MIEYAVVEKLIGAAFGNYHLEELILQDTWGLVFLARTDRETTPYLLRILANPARLEPKDCQIDLQDLHSKASQLVPLQHPNILPLLDYGSDHDLFYLVSPYISMRPLHNRLANHGPMDTLTTGRYLDQICAALEYAHQQGVIHGTLSVDCIYIRLDGQLVVSGFEMRNLLQLGREGAFTPWSRAHAPEQLLGKAIGTYTDVYSLGAVLFALLTGSPVFSGDTPAEIAQQHLYASVPPLNRWRRDLPAGLYSLVARALAKDPTQRFSRPGALANAYHHNVMPTSRSRVPFMVDSSPALRAYHPERTPAAQASVADMQLTERRPSDQHSSTALNQTKGIQRALPETPLPPSLPIFSASNSPRRRDARRFSFLHQFRRPTIPFVLLILVLLIVSSSGIGFALLLKRGNANTVASATGQATFFDGPTGPQGHTSSLHLVLHGLNAPPAGFQYAAWLINEQSEQVIALGTLIGANQTFSLSYTGESTNGQASINLLATGEKLEITLEQGTVKLPAGNVILVGKFPPQAFAHIQHLLVSFPATPGKIGVLVGTLEQTHLLNVQADVLQGLVPTRNSAAIQCAAQSLIDVIEGSKGPHYQPLAGARIAQNITATGDGFGLLGKGYLADAAEHAILAITQPDATNSMRLHGRLMAIALSNIKGWVSTIEQDALQLLKNPTDQTKVQEIAMLADDAYHGVDVNGDGQIDPVPGEAGALTAYLQGQLMATVSFTPSA